MNVDEITKIETGLSIEDYLNNMKNQSTWGGSLEIKSFSDIFNVRVDVLSLPNNRIIEFIPTSQNPRAKILIIWNGNHYTPYKNS